MVEVDKFIEESFAEIDADERAKIISNAKVLAALKGKSDSIGVTKVGDESIRFRLSVSKKLRQKMSIYKNKTSSKEPEMDELNTLMYDLLASLCIDEPWNRWQTWSVYDDNADIGAMEILLEIMNQVKNHIEDVKDFRRKSGRITPVEGVPMSGSAPV